MRRRMKRRTRRALEKGMMEIYPPDEWTGAPKTAQQLLDEAYLWEHHGYHDMAEILRAAAIDLESTTSAVDSVDERAAQRHDEEGEHDQQHAPEDVAVSDDADHTNDERDDGKDEEE